MKSMKEYVARVLIDKYLDNFFGYGEWNSSFWLIGLEEAGDYHREKIIKFYEKQYTKKSLIDNCKFQYEFYADFFEKKIQSTWCRVIQVLLYLEGNTNIFENENERHEKTLYFQINYWGRNATNRENDGVKSNALIEFLPLPSNTIDNVVFNERYNYKDFNEIFKNKNEYKKYCFENLGRIKYIARMAIEHAPALVIAYGKKYQAEFEELVSIVANVNIKQLFKIQIECQDGFISTIYPTYQTIFVCCHQPNTINLELEYWKKLAENISKIL